jgi:hypothetical protein
MCIGILHPQITRLRLAEAFENEHSGIAGRKQKLAGSIAPTAVNMVDSQSRSRKLQDQLVIVNSKIWGFGVRQGAVKLRCLPSRAGRNQRSITAKPFFATDTAALDTLSI